MTDERQGGPEGSQRKMGIGEGIRTGIGVLSAFKQAVEDTVNEAVERGDLGTDKARDAIQEALRRAQEAAGDVAGRLDVIPRREFDELRAAVAELSRRVDALEDRGPAASDHLLPAAGETVSATGPQAPSGGASASSEFSGGGAGNG